MSVWKSPLLYLGFLIILAAGAALAAPWFIDWETYRAEIERYGEQLLGREVKIAGRIDARLFPWPALRLVDVKIANPQGASIASLMAAERVELKMQLAPLLSGSVEVESIKIEKPVFGFERLPTGEGSWRIEPSFGGFVDPARVAVAMISISEGTVYLGDQNRSGVAKLDGFEAMMSAPALSGPWRLRGRASYEGVALGLAVSTGKLRAGEPAKLAVHIEPEEGPGLAYSFDGEVNRAEGKSIKGLLKIGPSQTGVAAKPEEGVQPQFTVRSELEADFDSIAFRRIEIAPSRSADASNFITGEADVALGKDIGVDARLEAARIDLDVIIGESGRELLRSPQGLDAFAGLLGRFPRNFDFKLALSVTNLVAGGETLEGAQLSADLTPERMRIAELSLSMPGQTRGLFSGTFLAGDGSPQLTGDFVLDSVSLRDFVVWAFPEERREIEEVWSGTRGRLKLATKADITPSSIRLSEAKASFDDAELSGGFTLKRGPEPALAIRFVADTLNIDRYAPQGPFPETDEDRSVLARVVDLIAGTMQLGDFQLTAQADRLQYHGVAAQDVAVDIGADENGVELRTIEIGSVGAARMDVTGLIRFPEEGVAGAISALVDAEDPRGLLRLLGAFGNSGEAEPQWAGVLGPLKLKLAGEAASKQRRTKASVSLTGSAGGSELKLDGRFEGDVANWQEGEVNLAGEAKAKSSVLLAELAGLKAGGEDRPARFASTATGSFRRGLATTAEAEIFGARAQFAGMLKEGKAIADLNGRLAVLAERAGELFKSLGLPNSELSPLADVLSAESELSYTEEVLDLRGLRGTAGGSSFNGDLKFALNPSPMITGRIAAGRLSLPWLLQASLMQADATDLSSRFATKLPNFADAELQITVERFEALPALALGKAAVSFKLDRDALRLSAQGTGPANSPADIEITAKLFNEGADVNASFEGMLDFGELFRADDGGRVMEGEGSVRLTFTGNGRSPAGLLAAARAQGNYELPRGVLKRVDPKAFGRDLSSAKRPTDIDQLITGSLRSGDMAFKGGAGSLILAHGVLTANPLAIEGDGIKGEMRFTLEAASGEADLSLTLSLAEPQGLPSFEIAYAGHPRALQASSNTRELKSRLAVKVLQEGIDQLEDLQRQERQLFEEEEAFRREQQERLEAERELERKVRALKARQKLSVEGQSSSIEKPEAAAKQDKVVAEPIRPPERAEVTDPQAPQLVIPQAQEVHRAQVPLPRTKPAARVGLEPSGPIILPQSLGTEVQRSPQPIFSGPTIIAPSQSSTFDDRVRRDR